MTAHPRYGTFTPLKATANINTNIGINISTTINTYSYWHSVNANAYQPLSEAIKLKKQTKQKKKNMKKYLEVEPKWSELKTNKKNRQSGRQKDGLMLAGRAHLTKLMLLVQLKCLGHNIKMIIEHVIIIPSTGWLLVTLKMQFLKWY